MFDELKIKIKTIIKENWLFFVLLLFLAIYLFYFTLSTPYHVDTTGYFNSVNDFQNDFKITCGYGNRCMVSYFLLPFSIFGDYAVKIGFILAALLFFVFSYLFLKKIFSNKTALVSTLLTILMPASLITITHLKEDFIGMMFFALAVYLITLINSESKTKSIVFSILSPIAMAFALLSKEMYLMFLPFYVLIYLYFFFDLENKDKITWKSIKDEFKLNKIIFLILQPIIIIITLFIIKPDYLTSIFSLTNSPYLGQFMGFTSPLFSSGFGLWIMGSGLILFILEIFSLSIFLFEKNKNRLILYSIFILQALILMFFLCNNSVMTYRNFFVFGFFLLPLTFTALEFALKKTTKELVVFIFIVLTIIISILLLSQTYKYLDYHNKYNPEKEFFSDFNLSPNIILLCMDDCGLASHYSKNNTIGHPVDANIEMSTKFVNELKTNAKGKIIYVLPDFFAYDSYGNIQNVIKANFNIIEYKKAYYENYHSIDFGYSLTGFKNQLKQRDCSVDYTKGDNYKLNEDTIVNQYNYNINCSGQVQKTQVFAYDEQVMPKLNIVSIYQLIPK